MPAAVSLCKKLACLLSTYAFQCQDKPASWVYMCLAHGRLLAGLLWTGSTREQPTTLYDAALATYCIP